MEQQDAKEATAVTRGQNVLYVMPHDWASIAHFLEPLLERIQEDAAVVQVVIITPDAQTAADIAAAAVRLTAERSVNVLAATSAARAMRLMRLRAPHVVAGAPAELLELVKSTTLKLGETRAVAFAWVDELISAGAETQLETLLTDMPKEGARVIVAAELTPPVEALVERYARRARRISASAPVEGEAGTPIEYVSVSAFTRAPTLRRLLDELDPASAVVFTRTPDSEQDARGTLRALGYGHDDDAIRAARAGGAGADLVVLYDLPAAREELREAVGATPKRVVALVQPRQLASLRALAGGAAVTPLALSEAAVRARGREAALRDQVRGVLTRETYARELLTLEPLLDDFDGIEIAGAVLVLLEKARAAAAEAARAAPSAKSTEGTKIFITIGSRDDARAGDIMGAVVNEGGIAREAVGRIEVRESFSLVEVPSAQAEEAASKLSGLVIKGRRVMARIDQPRPGRSGGDRGERGERGGRGGPGGDRRPRNGREGGRDGDRSGGGRSAPRGRSARGGPPERGARPARPRRERE